MNKTTSITLTPEIQSMIGDLAKHLRVRVGKGNETKEPTRATLYAAAIQLLHQRVMAGMTVVDLPALAFVSAEQARPGGGIRPAVLRTEDIYNKFTTGLREVTNAEEHLFKADARLINVKDIVKVRGLNFTPGMAGTSQGLEILLTGPYEVQEIRRRKAKIVGSETHEVHIFDLVKFNICPGRCCNRTCGNYVTEGREPFDETRHDLCGICEVADVAPMSTTDREALEQEVTE